MSDTEKSGGRKAIEVPSLSEFSASAAATAALNKPVKPKAVPVREFNKDRFIAKIMRAVASDAASKHPKMQVYVKWPRTATPHKDELFAEFEAAGYRLTLESTPVGGALCVDYKPAEA